MKGGLVVDRLRARARSHEAGAARARSRCASSSSPTKRSARPRARAASSTPRAGAACALVFESGRADDPIITRRKGIGAMTVVAHGKAAHAGNNHKDGANAIWALAQLRRRARRQLTDYARGVTVNVGKITRRHSARTPCPSAPRRCVDLRFETRRRRRGARRARCAPPPRPPPRCPASRIEVDGGISRAAARAHRRLAPRCATSTPRARAPSGLGDGEAPLLGGGSDANTVAPLGVPAIDGLGPRGAGFHTTTSTSSSRRSCPKAEALVRFLWGRLSQDVAEVSGAPVAASALSRVMPGASSITRKPWPVGSNTPSSVITSETTRVAVSG